MTNKGKDLVREAINKTARFCAYQERAPKEVRDKLAHYGLEGEELEQAFQEMVNEGFLNEQRFATAYAGGKLRIKKWGRLKIKRGLENYDLDQSCIQIALLKLSEDNYHSIMIDHIEKKRRSLKEPDPFIKNHKIAQFVIAKGFEPDLVWEYIKSQ